MLQEIAEGQGISKLTTEYLYWEIDTATNLDDVTSEVAFIDESNGGEPLDEDWVTAELVDHPLDPDHKAVRLLVGPWDGSNGSPYELESGDYTVWIRLTTDTERIVRRVERNLKVLG